MGEATWRIYGNPCGFCNFFEILTVQIKLKEKIKDHVKINMEQETRVWIAVQWPKGEHIPLVSNCSYLRNKAIIFFFQFTFCFQAITRLLGHKYLSSSLDLIIYQTELLASGAMTNYWDIKGTVNWGSLENWWEFENKKRNRAS